MCLEHLSKFTMENALVSSMNLLIKFSIKKSQSTWKNMKILGYLPKSDIGSKPLKNINIYTKLQSSI